MRADPASGAPGWQVTTRSHDLAVTVAGLHPGATAQRHRKGEWRAAIPQPVLIVTVIDAGTSTLWCLLIARPQLGTLALDFAPWPLATVLKFPPAALPAHGHLTARDMRVTTRMGRTVRYLIPQFTPS